MAKAAVKVNVEALMKKAQEFQTEAAAGIDALLLEIKEIRAAAESKISLVQEQVETLNNLYHSATGRYYVASPKAKEDKPSGDKQKRRSEDELKADAEALADAIKAAGREGAKGSALKSVAKVKAGMSIPDFIQKFTDYKIKTQGERAAMRYFIG